MHWKNKLKKIHPSLMILSVIFLICGYGYEVLIFLLALVIHEASHAMIAKKYGYKLSNFYLMPYGACLSYEGIFLEKEEIAIALAGPLSNLVTALLCIAVWWIFPSSYVFTKYFVQSNFYLAIFNFLPCYPLDCGRIVRAIIKDKYSEKFAIKIAKFLSCFFVAVFFLMFLISFFVKINFNFLMISIVLLFGLFDNKFQGKYEKILKDKSFYLKKGINTKTIAITGKTSILNLTKKISSTKYNIFYVIGDEKVAILTETKLLKLCERYNPTTTLDEILSI